MKKQALLAKIYRLLITVYWLLFTVFLGGCREAVTTLPTPITVAELPTTAVPLINTPTLAANAPAALPTATLSPLATAGETAVFTNRSIGDPYTPELGNLGYDVQAYTIALTLDPADPRVQQAATTLDLVITDPALTELSFDFIGFENVAVSSGATPLPFRREDDKLLVELAQPVAAGTPLGLTVRYSGEPTRRQSPYVGFVQSLGLTFANGMVYALAEPDGARFWFPSNDHPRDKAFYRFELTVPEGLTAVANGTLRQTNATTLPNGRSATTFTWQHDHPMASYLAVVAVGEFERIEASSPQGVPLRHYVAAPAREDFRRMEAVTGEALDWLSGLLGPYPFETFGFVTVDAPQVALETQTLSIVAFESVGAKTAVHELVHMWFGNHVSLHSWQEMWRNEGFATYFELLWQMRGESPEAVDGRIAEMAGAVEQNGGGYPLGNPPPAQLFGFNTYFEGATAVHALRRQLGDEVFFTGLRLYLERYGGGTASDSDFQAVMEEASGQSLDAFFTEWLE
ncbi:MAG: M1 family metallopeptidase [Chloroflexota bacterium]